MSEQTIYYKAFNRDMTCRDFQYEEGGVYEIGGDPVLCGRGFHFVKDLVLSLGYYPVNNDITENFYAEVEPLGEVVWEEPTKHKGCTNKLKITRIIPDDEVKKMVDPKNNSGEMNSGDRNSGNRNSGYGNSGNWNSGNWNSGDRNSGNWNSGNWNSGDRNSGHGNSGSRNSGSRNSGNRNSGNRNSGNWNSGDRNSGHGNSGNWNSGDWNSCDRESGAFNTEQSNTIRVFNKDCDRGEWESAYKPDFLYFAVDKSIGYKASFQKSWDNADEAGRERVRDLPNFDADVFFEISGIDLRATQEEG